MNRRLRFTTLLALLLLASLALVLGPALAQGGPDPLTAQVPLLRPEVISVRPHDPAAYTQGLLLYDGSLYESTGLRGESTLREVDPETGEVLRSIDIEERYFAEGLERVGDRLIQLTWQEGEAFVYDLETFERLETFRYQGEGWGLCTDGRWLYMSDGTPFISLRDPQTFELVFRGLVTLQGRPVYRLNELECVEDSIYANVWQTDYILQIDRLNGVVTAVIDASGLLTEEEQAALFSPSQDVLNGIAYNPETETFLITGKRWPHMYEVRFVEAQAEE